AHVDHPDRLPHVLVVDGVAAGGAGVAVAKAGEEVFLGGIAAGDVNAGADTEVLGQAVLGIQTDECGCLQRGGALGGDGAEARGHRELAVGDLRAQGAGRDGQEREGAEHAV
ncbi:MAG: hypothetical protein ACK56I_30180, partial [bacterium]